MELLIRPMTKSDWQAVASIYKQGIDTGHATFDQETPTWEEWDKEHLKPCRLVAVVDQEVIAWAALSDVSSRCIYQGVGEVSVYVSEKSRGQKVGTKLLTELIKLSEESNFWTLQAGIFPENKGSIKIHESLGFRIVGYREKIGKMNGVWRDTLLMERRSKLMI